MRNSKKLFCLLLFALALSLPALSQDEPDSAAYVFYDSSQLEIRHFDEATIRELQSDPDLTYSTDRATVSLWTRFWRWFRQLLGALFSQTATSDWGELLIYVLAIVLLVYAVIALMKLDAVRIFFGSKNPESLTHTIIEENIHEMDFDKLLEEAMARKDLRLAIRLHFLQGLKILSDKQLIHWEPGKTNQDYINEISVAELKRDFRELNFYFEYTWYGNFELTSDLFGRIKEKFTAWKIKL